MSFVVQQSSLHLTPSFGNQSFFQVLKFPGGITVIPPQSAFLLQKNLYVRLTNVNGSTVAPPTIVQTSVVLAIGNIPPSVPRLKQLAQAITGSHAGNLE
ncbi:hypothetical protein QJS04_geneDACA022220 [Acorus gramineus]|uniref:Uncharacterized protein n=1 Tax=Acorus gramineus TaxID=55184 RepID=A0AAV9BKZ5_ACOGR|nr:hypothetical protein QJS04_geneDACA022220 [Acorus gramineus]